MVPPPDTTLAVDDDASPVTSPTAVPTGAAATVRLGTGQPIPIVQGPWTNIQTDIDDAVNGVFADNAVAQPGVAIVCVVSFIAPGSPSARAFQVQNT